MKKLGIIGAMQEEVDTLIKLLKNKKETIINHLTFFAGIYKNVELIVVRCGVGKVNAAMCSQLLIDKFNPDYIINIGVAGAVSDDVDICDIVISTHLVEHDFDCTAFGYKKGVIPRLDDSKFKADEYLLELSRKSRNNLSNKIKFFEGVIASGDIFVSSKEIKDELQNLHLAMCTEMEGAAIAHVCSLNNVPFLVIRSMSDKADGKAPNNFNQFVIDSAENSRVFIQEMIENM